MPDGDWGEEYLREMDERKRQGDRAQKWKQRAEAAETERDRLRKALKVAEERLIAIYDLAGDSALADDCRITASGVPCTCDQCHAGAR